MDSLELTLTAPSRTVPRKFNLAGSTVICRAAGPVPEAGCSVTFGRAALAVHEKAPAPEFVIWMVRVMGARPHTEALK